MPAPHPAPLAPSPAAPEVLDRREGPYGEVVLRRHGGLLQIIANGTFLMDTSDGRSERLLVDAAREALGGRTAPRVLIGGLGVGFSLSHAAADPGWGRITVVEREPAVIDWHTAGEAPPLAGISGAALADRAPRWSAPTCWSTCGRRARRTTRSAWTSTTGPTGR